MGRPPVRCRTGQVRRRTASMAVRRPCFELALLACMLALPCAIPAHGQQSIPRAAVGDAGKLERRYERWRSAPWGADVRIPLAPARAGAARHPRAVGQARIDVAEGRIELRVRGLHEARAEVWLLPFAEGPPWHLGSLRPHAGAARLVAVLPPHAAGFELERIVVGDPAAGAAGAGEAEWIGGSPSLFQRAAGGGVPIGGLVLAAGPPVAGAPIPPRAGKPFEDLVDLGEQLFFEETFAGNGRTCGTCHPAENDFTIDPPFIASLPPDDPLFVAETVPALDSRLNGGLVFEVPELLRQRGLVVVNADGFDDLTRRFVLRGVSHLLALGTRIEPAPALDQPLRHLTGWSGDGAPGSGSLREFALGAVRQHFPRTLARVPGVDFRLPSPLELNALEAFQLALGRESDLDLAALAPKDAGAEHGRQLFHVAGACSFCHPGGGATGDFAGIGLGTFLVDTGVEAFAAAHPDGTGIPRPIDGGFGTDPEGGLDELEPNRDGSFGDRRFAVQSVIEAADTLPAFHGNLTGAHGDLPDTIEGAIAFYASAEFAERVFPIVLDGAEIAALGRFLRVLNALENLRAAEEYRERAEEDLLGVQPDLARVTRIAGLAAAECEDAGRVLGEVGLHPLARQEIAAARRHFLAAHAGSAANRLAEIEAAAPRLAAAVADIRH